MKYIQTLFTENYNLLLKEIKGLNKLRAISCSVIERFNIVKVSKQFQKEKGFFVEISELILMFL